MAVKTKSEKWFEDNIVEDAAELEAIGETADRLLHDKVNLEVGSGKKIIAIYCNIFDEIIEVIKSKQDAGATEYELNIADRLIIGYTNNQDDDDEKVGNLMVYMKHKEPTQSDDSLSDDTTSSTIELSTQWNSINIKEQHDVMKEIMTRARKRLDEFINIKTESNEFIIPMFAIIHSAMIAWLKLKRAELDLPEKEISVAGYYTVGVMLSEFQNEEPDEDGNTVDVKEEVYYVPGIALKRKFKNDATAGGSDE